MATVNAIRIGPADHGRRMSLEEFREAEEEEGYRYELARGVLEVTLVPNDPHGVTVWRLIFADSGFTTALVRESSTAPAGRVSFASGSPP